MVNTNFITKIKSFPVRNSLGLVIILEILLSIIIILVDYGKAYSIGGELFINNVSILTKTLLTLSILENSKTLFLGASVLIFLKFISAIGILKNKKFFSIFATFLYFADLICALYLFLANAPMITELSTYSIILSIGYMILIGLLIFFSFSSFFVFNNTYLTKPFLEKDNKSAKIAILSSIVLIVTIEVTVIALSFINKDNVLATREEIEVVNRCYEYSEKYLYKKLPQDENVLNSMLNDIEKVTETDIFKRAFNKSCYHEKLIETRDLSKTTNSIDYNGPIIQKSAYITDLVFLKCKILLSLDKNIEFYSYYDKNKDSFSFATELFFVYVDNNLENFSKEDIATIDTLCRNILKSDDTQKNKTSAWTTLVILYSSDPNYENDKKNEMTQLRKKYIDDYDFEKYLNSDLKLPEIKDGLYMLS